MNIQKKYFLIISLFFLFLVAVLFFLNDQTEEQKILAKVGSKEITERDFLLNYEFGLPHLKTGKTSKERKSNYLQFMINEYLIALDAEEKGVEVTPEVKYQTEKLKRELLLESIIENDVKPNVNVSMDEIKEAISKSKVSFKFFYWNEKDLKNALIIKDMFTENGIEETFKILSQKKSDFHFDISKYITEYLTYLDIPEETLEAIQNLPAHEFSEPVKIDDRYFIFQVMDIRRTTVTSKEYLDKASTFRKILFNAKLQDEVVKYVDKQVTPQNIKAKTKFFNVFANAIIDWYRDENKSNLIFSEWTDKNRKIASVQKFYNYQDSVLITYKNGTFTLKEFQKHFYFDKITEEYQTKNQFKHHINDIILMSIRDYFLEIEARRKGYDKSDWFKHEFMKWTSKFAFEDQLFKYMSHKSPDTISVKSRINNDLKILKSKYDVIVDYKMLDTLSVNETEKSKQTTVQLMKSGLNRLAEPIVDGHWKSISK